MASRGNQHSRPSEIPTPWGRRVGGVPRRWCIQPQRMGLWPENVPFALLGIIMDSPSRCEARTCHIRFEKYDTLFGESPCFHRYQFASRLNVCDVNNETIPGIVQGLQGEVHLFRIESSSKKERNSHMQRPSNTSREILY